MQVAVGQFEPERGPEAPYLGWRGTGWCNQSDDSCFSNGIVGGVKDECLFGFAVAFGLQCLSAEWGSARSERLRRWNW
jgi:hypothetical protein